MEHYFIFKLHFGLTFYMTGIIWLIQMIHYPLFKLVGQNAFNDYHKGHLRHTSLVIAIPMTLEMLTGLYILIRDDVYRNNSIFLASYTLLGFIWIITFFISVPKHNILSQGFNVDIINSLIKTNWSRTIAWSLRCALLFYLFD